MPPHTELLLREKQILARAIEIKKENWWRPHNFHR